LLQLRLVVKVMTTVVILPVLPGDPVTARLTKDTEYRNRLLDDLTELQVGTNAMFFPSPTRTVSLVFRV
jgi:hypothetical protein